jgi:hypothetical protein
VQLTQVRAELANARASMRTSIGSGTSVVVLREELALAQATARRQAAALADTTAQLAAAHEALSVHAQLDVSSWVFGWVYVRADVCARSDRWKLLVVLTVCCDHSSAHNANLQRCLK